MTMKRLDWHLVRPARPGSVGVPELERRIDELVERATEKVLDDEELAQLLELEDLHDSETISTCEAVGAPRVEDDPDWEGRTIDEYAETDTDLDLEEYLEIRRSEPDCERCPFASAYSLFPLDPCEFSAGALWQVTSSPAILRIAGRTMSEADMNALATAVEAALEAGQYTPVAALDASDYLRKAAAFLRLWARHGFRVRAVAADEEAPVLTPDAPPDPATEDEDEDDDSDPSPVLH